MDLGSFSVHLLVTFACCAMYILAVTLVYWPVTFVIGILLLRAYSPRHSLANQ
jgi:hypothetical protein